MRGNTHTPFKPTTATPMCASREYSWRGKAMPHCGPPRSLGLRTAPTCSSWNIPKKMCHVCDHRNPPLPKGSLTPDFRTAGWRKAIYSFVYPSIRRCIYLPILVDLSIYSIHLSSTTNPNPTKPHYHLQNPNPTKPHNIYLATYFLLYLSLPLLPLRFRLKPVSPGGAFESEGAFEGPDCRRFAGAQP